MLSVLSQSFVWITLSQLLGGTVEKYGTDGKMTLANFELWWSSTYTTYNEDALTRMVDELNDEPEHMESIPELPEVPHNTNVAISRS